MAWGMNVFDENGKNISDRLMETIYFIDFFTASSSGVKTYEFDADFYHLQVEIIGLDRYLSNEAEIKTDRNVLSWTLDTPVTLLVTLYA